MDLSHELETVSGVITDPTGAVIPGAELTLRPASSQPGSDALRVQTNRAGRFSIQVPDGQYVLHVEAPGFAPRDEPLLIQPGATAKRGSPSQIDIQLRVAEYLQMDVEGQPLVNRGASALVITNSQIQMMPIDSAALLDELRSMAGSPDAALFVDGFSRMPLPPRSQIREIRINQSPYSARNDTDPINGMIQVLTRPGTDKLHGEAYVDGDTSVLNARNPFVPEQPSYYAFSDGALVTGSLLRSAAFVAGYDDAENRTNALINPDSIAQSLIASAAAVPDPLSTITVTTRVDLQPAKQSTLNIGYNMDRVHQTNGGVGQLALTSQGFDNIRHTDAFRMSYTQGAGEHLLNDLRVQYLRERTGQTPVSTEATLLVEGAFLGGGNNLSSFSDHQDRVELLDDVSMMRGTHEIGFGGRVRTARDANRSYANFNGEFIFSTVSAFQATAIGRGNEASQYSITAGNPNASVLMVDTGEYAQDDWQPRSNLTINYGLRFESQNFVQDHMDWAPRVGFSYGFGRSGSKDPGRYVLHGGSGLFYERFPINSALLSVRQNGVNEQQYIVADPNFFEPPPGTAYLGPQTSPTVYKVSGRYRSPYYLDSGIALDRRMGRLGAFGITWLSSRGVHTLLTENINAPLPGTYNSSDPTSGIRPLGGTFNLYSFASDGIFRSSRISATLNLHTRHYTVYAYYTVRFDRSDAEEGSFPSNPYDVGADYGRASSDIRHTVTVRGAANFSRGIWCSGYIHTLSGAPFDIVLNRDRNGDSIFNDRPAFATDLTRSSVVITRWGTFDTDPIPGQRIIPRNLGQGPIYVMVTVAAGKTFTLTLPRSTGGARSGQSPELQLWAQSQNVLNHPNYTLPVDTLGSPLFGQSLALSGASTVAPDRVFDFHLSFRF